jgi:hypothetical protein
MKGVRDWLVVTTRLRNHTHNHTHTHLVSQHISLVDRELLQHEVMHESGFSEFCPHVAHLVQFALYLALLPPAALQHLAVVGVTGVLRVGVRE